MERYPIACVHTDKPILLSWNERYIHEYKMKEWGYALQAKIDMLVSGLNYHNNPLP